MIVTKCWFDIHLLTGANSLKGKRHVIKSLKELIKNRFNVSVAEVGETNLWQRAELGIVFVTQDADQGEQVYQKILNFLDNNENIEVVDIFHEVEKVK